MKFLQLGLVLVLLSFSRAQLDPGFVGKFIMQPVGTSVQTLSTTAQTVFTGTLYVSVQPQIWYMELDDAAPDGLTLTNTRRWATPDGFSGNPNFEQDFTIEMSYYRNNVSAVEDCCSQTPLYDEFFIPVVNQYYGIRYAGRPATFLIYEPISNTINVTLLEEVVAFWDDQVTSGECPLRCLSPVDVVYVGDASGSIDNNQGSNLANWQKIREFVSLFSSRFFFTPEMDGVRFSLTQFAGMDGSRTNNPDICENASPSFSGSYEGRYGSTSCSGPGVTTGVALDRICILTAPDASNCTENENVCDWGLNYPAVVGVSGQETLYSNWAKENCYDIPRTLPSADYTQSSDCGLCTPNRAGWAFADTELTGNEPYFNYAVSRYTNSFFDIDDWSGWTRQHFTGIGQGMVLGADLLERGHRGKQQIMITLTDGGENRGIKVAAAVPLIKDQLNALDGPPVRLVAIGVGSDIVPSQVQEAADNIEENTIIIEGTIDDAFDKLSGEIDRLVSLSCDAEFDFCQGTCAGFCSPCGDCLCPACPDLECQTSLGCENGICVYAEPEEKCCPTKFVEQCEKQGGELDEDCKCTFGSGDGSNTGAVVGGTIGGLIGAVLLGLLALLLIVALLAALVTVIILILKAQAIAAAIASLGANAFGAGGNQSNPTYEGATLEGDNPLFTATGL